MKVVILAAGRSTRLKPIADKNFLKFLGKPLIQHQLDMLHAAGFVDFIVVGGAHNLKDLVNLSADLPYDIKIMEQINLEEGMAGAVKTVQPEFLENEEMLLVSSNDIVEAKAYELVKQASKDLAWDGAMIGKKVEAYFPGGYLEIDSERQILKVVEKPGKGNEPSDMINLVIHYFRKPQVLFKALETVQSERDDKYEVALSTIMNEGTKVQALPYDGFWQAIKYPWHIQPVFHFLIHKEKKRISRNSVVAKSATIKGHVIIEDGVRVFENAVISGPAYLGKGCIVANNGLVRDANLGEGCVVGYSTEIARSFLGNDVWTHTNYIGDSVIGNNVSFGSGTVTGNLRLDEKNIIVDINGEKIDCGAPKFGLITGDRVRVGINTSFMPGVKIGNDSFIGAGILVAEDIEDGKYVYAKTELIVKDNKSKVNDESREEFKKKV